MLPTTFFISADSVCECFLVLYFYSCKNAQGGGVVFITLEGIENSGKSTQASLLAGRFRELGIPCVLTRDPGGVSSSEPIRRVLLDRSTEVGVKAELLLYIAARVELVEKVIRPALDAGNVVICDRFIDSTIAYQGYGNFYGDEEMLGFIKSSHDLLTGGLWPDLTIWLDISVEESMRRYALGSERDRIESRDGHFFLRVKHGYYLLHTEDRDRVRMVSGEAPEEVVANIIWQQVQQVIVDRGCVDGQGRGHIRAYRRSAI